MRCPSCHDLIDRVVDSRSVDGGAGIRRRRQCVSCGARFTTFERVDEAPLVVIKSDDTRQPFDRSKIEAGVLAAAKGRPLSAADAGRVATAVEDALCAAGGEVSTADVGRLVLDELAGLDEVTYMRFASVYKAFQGIGDFEAELGRLSKVPRDQATI
ncbi:MAG: transcriptional regulator NrdR [Microthrixaceae bacterium]